MSSDSSGGWVPRVAGCSLRCPAGGTPGACAGADSLGTSFLAKAARSLGLLIVCFLDSGPGDPCISSCGNGGLGGGGWRASAGQ